MASYDERRSLLRPEQSPRYFNPSSSYISIGDESRTPLSAIPENRSTAYMGRKRERIRTTSVSILNLAGDADVVGTSFGPVVLPDDATRTRDWMLGWFLAIISGVLFTANNFFVKYLSVDPLEMLIIRSGLQTVLIMFGLISTKTPFLPPATKDRILVILQGILSGARVFLQFACLAFMPLGDALTLVFTEPLWTIILSKIILRIDIGWWKSIFGLFLIGGMVLCIQPPFLFDNSSAMAGQNNTEIENIMNMTQATTIPSTIPTVHPSTFQAFTTDIPVDATKEPDGDQYQLLQKITKITGIKQLRESYNEEHDENDEDDEYGSRYYVGVILALSTAITGSLANVIIAKVEGASSSLMVFYSGIGGVLLGLGFSFFDPENRLVFNIGSIAMDEWIILLMLGGSGLIGYYSMTRSLQLIPPTTVAVLRALEIILAYIAQALVMGEIPNVLAVTGSSIVMFSVIGFALEETLLSCYNCY